MKNVENGRFTLTQRYEFGEEAELKYSYAPDYLEYLGTDKLTNEQIKQQFYKLACNYSINVGARNINVTLSGLSENMPQALALLENVMQNAKVDADAWEQYIQLVEKGRADAKLEQRSNFSNLVAYGIYGPYNSNRNILSSEQLRQTNPQELLNLLKNLKQYEHTLLYYGPMTEKELCDAVTKQHKTGKKFQPVPVGKHYTRQTTQQNEVLMKGRLIWGTSWRRRPACRSN